MKVFNFLETNWVNRANQKYIPNNRCRGYQSALPLSETSLFISTRTAFSLTRHTQRRFACSVLRNEKNFPWGSRMVVFGSFCNQLMWVYHQIIIPCCDFPSSYSPTPALLYPFECSLSFYSRCCFFSLRNFCRSQARNVIRSSSNNTHSSLERGWKSFFILPFGLQIRVLEITHTWSEWNSIHNPKRGKEKKPLNVLIHYRRWSWGWSTFGLVWKKSMEEILQELAEREREKFEEELDWIEFLIEEGYR